ncbi:MAG: DegV family protein [Chloroflexi bacterium]|nr:DegV family protein [Chloroflexota bacterium]
MIRIVTDSVALLPNEVVKQHDISVIPILVIFGDKVYREGVDISYEELFARLPEADPPPSTSQPSVGEFRAVYQQVLDESPGATILSIHISSGLSGAVEAARQAAIQMPTADIHVYDSQTLGLEQGFQVIEAARMAKAGVSLAAMIKHLDCVRENSASFNLVDTMVYLFRGGRVKQVGRLADQLLGVKPILTVRNGSISPYALPRTRAAGIRLLTNRLESAIQNRERVLIGVMHANVKEVAQELLDSLTERYQPELGLLSWVGAGLALHTGPGALGLTWSTPPALPERE